MPNFQFYGSSASVQLWRTTLIDRVAAICEEIEVDPKGAGTSYERFRFKATLDDAQLKIMGEVWYEENGLGKTATGTPYRWNDCITFLVIKPKKSKKSK